MWLAPMRSVSGRIVLAVFVLLATFTAVSGYSIYRLSELGRALRFVRAAYLQISPDITRLALYTGGMLDYIDEPNTPIKLVSKNREFRRDWLVQAIHKLDDLTEVPQAQRATVRNMRERLSRLLQDHQANDVHWAAAFTNDRGSAAAGTARNRLQRGEGALQREFQSLQAQLQNDALVLTGRVEHFDRRARLVTLGLGGGAVLLATMVAWWTILTLRPLRRLRDGARRVAEGDYRGRVAVAGGTEVAELARELNAMATAIEEREQELVRSARLAAVGKMAAVITHEVRNPLSSIGLNAELLEDELSRISSGGSSDEARTLLRSMQSELDRLTGITEEYLRFARLPRPKLEPESVNAIVASLLEFQREELGLRGIEVAAALAEDLPLVAADEAQLRQALLNLVRNAAEAMSPGGGTLTMTTGRGPDGTVEVQVTDTGQGIPPDMVAKIFEPFFSTKEGGTGLGLALTQQIVGEHDGRIDVKSAAVRGTTFVVRLRPYPPQPHLDLHG